MNIDGVQAVLGCVFALTMMIYAYRGGPVRYGTIPMPSEGRVIILICAVLILAHFLKRFVLLAWK